MKTSPAMVSRAESGANVTFDTFEKYAVAAHPRVVDWYARSSD